MKIVFMGTPDFAVPTLEALIRGGHQVAAVVTQPDKPKGRGKAVLMTPVKEKAMEYGIPVYQPARVKQDDEFFQVLKALSPDAVVVTAFGQILPRGFWSFRDTAVSMSMPPCSRGTEVPHRFSGP